ncbi:MAG: hypothetical protein U0359_32085 [Byssovorax sp.]
MRPRPSAPRRPAIAIAVRAALAALLASACGAPPSHPSLPPEERAPGRAGDLAAYRYRVAAAPHGEELYVEAELPPGSHVLRGQDPIEPFVRDVEVDAGHGFAPASASPRGFLLGGCEQGCRVRYRLMLAEAAGLLDDPDLARRYRGALLSPPSAFLLRPAEASPDGRYRLSVFPSPGEGFVTGVIHEEPDGDTVLGRLGDLVDAPYSAFGALTRTRAKIPGGTLDIALIGGQPRMGRAALERWIVAQATAVSAYFGRFPIAHAAILALVGPGAGIGNGRTMGNGGGSVLLQVGADTTDAALRDDWVLVHELCHVSFPNVLRPWAEEGLATYLEPIIRARAGTLSRDAVWRALIEGLPEGQPEDDDRGLDHTDTWGRRYWGGAMFWLLADIQIRKESGGARSLRDALRAVADAGGNVGVTWSLDRALTLGDAAVGGSALRDLRKRLGDSPVTIDLAELFTALGVRLDGDRVVYNDGAQFASIRRAITEPEAR